MYNHRLVELACNLQKQRGWYFKGKIWKQLILDYRLTIGIILMLRVCSSKSAHVTWRFWPLPSKFHPHYLASPAMASFSYYYTPKTHHLEEIDFLGAFANIAQVPQICGTTKLSQYWIVLNMIDLKEEEKS